MKQIVLEIVGFFSSYTEVEQISSKFAMFYAFHDSQVTTVKKIIKGHCLMFNQLLEIFVYG